MLNVTTSSICTNNETINNEKVFIWLGQELLFMNLTKYVSNLALLLLSKYSDTLIKIGIMFLIVFYKIIWTILNQFRSYLKTFCHQGNKIFILQ